MRNSVQNNAELRIFVESATNVMKEECLISEDGKVPPFLQKVFLAPVMIQLQILLQATWKTKEAWDDEVNDEIRKKFFKMGKEQLKYFKNIKIPRWLGVMEEPNLSIHTFVDAILTWIIRREQWSVFVANRISEIRKLTTSEDSFHISTDQNPADILSRGCGPKQLQKRKWWQGPDWLKNSKEQ
ncbi:uncharacterized protein TNCV_1350531 [Trichonephila clavipes]|nr:uncharacterized protein TNCV_1350531 [Trichonephila clavipes]